MLICRYYRTKREKYANDESTHSIPVDFYTPACGFTVHIAGIIILQAHDFALPDDVLFSCLKKIHKNIWKSATNDTSVGSYGAERGIEGKPRPVRDRKEVNLYEVIFF